MRETVYIKSLQNKLNEALKAVLPIIGIVLLLAFSIAPMPNDVLLAFLMGGLMLIVTLPSSFLPSSGVGRMPTTPMQIPLTEAYVE